MGELAGAAEGRRKEALLKVGAVHLAELFTDGFFLLGFVPEEEHTLFAFIVGGGGGEDGFEGVGMDARAVDDGGDGHWRGGEVLDLFEFEIEVVGLGGEHCHIYFAAARVAGDEVWDELLVEAVLAVDVVELAHELVEEGERGFAHDVEDGIGGVFGGYLEAARDVVGDELLDVGLMALLLVGRGVVVEEHIVAHTAADERLLDGWNGVDFLIEAEQAGVVGIHVLTDLWEDAGGAGALLAQLDIAPPHSVHIGGGSAEVGEIALEAREFRDKLDLAEDGRFGARGDELALMGRDGAETASAETTSMEVDGVLDHLVGGDVALAVVAGVREVGIGEVERVVDLLGRHWLVLGIDDDELVANFLDEPFGVPFIALLLNMVEVVGIELLVVEASLMAIECERLPAFVFGERLGSILEESDLGDGAERGEGDAAAEERGDFGDRVLAHAVDEEVGTALDEYSWAELVLPIVVVSEPSETGLDAAEDDGDIGVELLQDAGVDDGGHIGAAARLSAWSEGIVVATSAASGIVVDHGIHGAGGDAEKVARNAEFLEVAEVVLPIGLWDDGHLEAFGFEDAPDDGGPERGVVDIGIAAEEDDIHLVPAP